MTPIIIDRAVVEQALEALTPWMGGDASHTEQYAAYHALRAALAQQAEPVEPVAWMYDCGGGGRMYAEELDDPTGWIALYTAPPQQAEPVEAGCETEADCTSQPWCRFKGECLRKQAEPVASLNAWAEQRLARHGIQACLYPQCVGGQSGTVCHKHCPTPCTDCRGIGYDASGQLCGCQQNPSF